MNNENDSKQSKTILYYNAPISDRKKEEEDSTLLQVISLVGYDKLVKHQKLTVPCLHSRLKHTSRDDKHVTFREPLCRESWDVKEDDDVSSPALNSRSLSTFDIHSFNYLSPAREEIFKH